MSLTSDELNAFHTFAVSALADHRAESLQELVDLWEQDNLTPDVHDQNVAAVRAAIRDMNAGDLGRPAQEVINELRLEISRLGRA